MARRIRRKSLTDISMQADRVRALNKLNTKNGGYNRADRIVRAVNQARAVRGLSRFSPDRTTKRGSRSGLISG